VRDPSLRALLLDEDRLTEAAIEDMVLRFLSEVKDGAWSELGHGCQGVDPLRGRCPRWL
jgi:hypothetical protein